jgi:hypothetical protein
MATLYFPSTYKKRKTKNVHFEFFIQYAQLAGINVSIVEPNDSVFIGKSSSWSCLIDNKRIVVDYGDNNEWYHHELDYYKGCPYFKFQSSPNNHNSHIPLGPPIVGTFKSADLKNYFDIRNNFSYSPKSKILNKQRPHATNKERRTYVRKLLQPQFKNVDINGSSNQSVFWKESNNCLVSVCVPGWCNNMIDRGHMELLGLGVCTVSPKPKTILPYRTELQPNVHYLQSKDDYSDLVDIIKNLTPEKSKQIGDNARKLFDDVFAPEKYWNYIIEETDKFYGK